MDHYQAKSKGTWGRTEPKTAAELNLLCNEFFEKLVVPPDWKFMKWSNAIDPTLGLISVGKAFRDMRTSGIDLMHYRIYFSTFSQHGGVCEISIVTFGKYAHKSVGHGIFKIEELNKFIAERYNELPDLSVDPLQGDNDKEDGLQHFRDRFGDTAPDEVPTKFE